MIMTSLASPYYTRLYIWYFKLPLPGTYMLMTRLNTQKVNFEHISQYISNHCQKSTAQALMQAYDKNI